ncbi:hypothetical protein RS030_111790 [Cryptosporidium xiaoi]|uniref:Trm112p-like protein n=1 Tax=Cryptosporidium xiaoi TaxID=659607 RepID=A0AAV9Y334_9CRYT|nr:hypothetical protein FG379_002061 [Cryptosporidium bovis]
MCNRPECKNGFPLRITLNGTLEESTKYIETEQNNEQIQCLIDRIDWDVFVRTASDFGIELPICFSEQDKKDDMFLTAVHDALMKIMEGKLTCPVCKFEYNISKGIPNMLHKPGFNDDSGEANMD